MSAEANAAVSAALVGAVVAAVKAEVDGAGRVGRGGAGILDG